MKQRLINFLLKHTLNAVTPTDIITSNKLGIYIDGTLVTESELKQLQAEVKALEGFRVWNLITQTLKKDAYDRGLITSTSMEHLNMSKSMIYNLSIQESILKVIKNAQIH